MLVENIIEPCHLRVDGEEIHGLRCKRTLKVYHRSPSKTVESILKKGLKPSEETGSVSLSSNPRHTYGGEVRFVIDTKDLDLRPICYVFGEERKKLTEFEEKVREKLSKEYASLNKIYDYLGAYPGMYLRECEWSTKESIPPDKIEVVEFWIGFRPGEYAVSCENTVPHISIIDSETQWDNFKYKLKRVKESAEKHGKKFVVRSCFRFMKLPCRLTESESRLGSCLIELSEENLKRIEEEKKPLPYKGDRKFIENIKYSDDYMGCVCRC